MMQDFRKISIARRMGHDLERGKDSLLPRIGGPSRSESDLELGAEWTAVGDCQNIPARNHPGLVHGANGGTFRRRRPDPFLVDVEGVLWVCVSVRTRREFTVADDFQAAGYPVLCPHGVRVQRRARVGKSAAGGERRGLREIDYPVFGPYLFIGESAGLPVTKSKHIHVLSVLENAGGSRHVPAEFISAVAKMWLAGKWDERRRENSLRRNPLRTGDAVRLDSLGELIATVDKLPNETQAIIRYALFGKDHKQKVDVSRLELV